MAVLDQGVNLAGEQIDTGQQTDCAIALVLVVARKGRMFAGLRRQVRGRRSEGLNAGLLVIGDDRHRIAGLLVRSGRGLFNLTESTTVNQLLLRIKELARLNQTEG